LLIYFVRVELVTSPKITAFLRCFIISVNHGAYVIADCKVINMEQLRESQVRELRQ